MNPFSNKDSVNFIELARHKFEHQDYDGVIKMCEEALKLNSKDEEAKSLKVSAHKLRANLYTEAKEFEKAIADLNTVLEHLPQDWESLRLRAVNYHDIKEYNKALSDLCIDLRSNPNNLVSLYNRGLNYLMLDYSEHAIKDFDIILKSQTKNGELLPDTAKCYFLLNQFDKAIECSTLALKESQDNHFSAYSVRSRCYLFQREYKAAKEDILAALKIKSNADLERLLGEASIREGILPENLKDPYLQALAQIGQGKWHDAIATAQKMEDNKGSKALYILAEAHCGLKLYEKAIDFATRSINIDGYNPFTYMCLAGSNFVLKKYDQTIKQCSEVLKYNASDECALSLRVQSFAELQKHAEALVDATTLLKKVPHNIHNLLLRAVIFCNLKQWDAAIEDLKLPLEENPNDPTSLFWRSMAYTGLNRYEEAIKDGSKALDITSENIANYHSILGECYFAMKDFKNAAKSLSIVIESKKASDDHYLMRARSYFHLKEFDSALSDIGQCKNGPVSLVQLRGELCLQKGQLKDALADFNRLLNSYPDNIEYLMLRSKTYLKNKDYASATADAQQILTLEPSNVVAFKLLAEIKDAEGKTGEALLYTFQALEQTPRAKLSLFEIAKCALLKHHDHATMSFRKDLRPYTIGEFRNICGLLEKAQMTPQGINTIEQFQGIVPTPHIDSLAVLVTKATCDAIKCFDRALMLYEAESFDEALIEINEYLKHSSCFDVLKLKGEILLEKKAFKAAVAVFSELLMTKKMDDKLFILRAKAYLGDMKYTLAKSDVEKALFLKPSDDSKKLLAEIEQKASCYANPVSQFGNITNLNV